MAEPVRHRQTKEAATDMFDLQPLRHIPTLPIGTEMRYPRYVRFSLDSDRRLDIAGRLERAKPGSSGRYSITSSARASREGGIVRPSALAVLRLMTSSNRVDCATGRSAGLAPLRMRPT